MSGSTNVNAHGTRVVVGRIGRSRRGGTRPAGSEAATPSMPPGPPRVVRVLALAISIQQAIDRGEIRDLAAAARKFGLSRARLTQISDLALLSPRIQEAVLAMRTEEGAEPIVERRLHDLLSYDSWTFQEAAWISTVAFRTGALPKTEEEGR